MLIKSFWNHLKNQTTPVKLLGRPHALDKEPVVPVVVATAVELAIATTVAQAVTIRGIVRCSGPPVPVPSKVERAIDVAATGDSGESS